MPVILSAARDGFVRVAIVSVAADASLLKRLAAFVFIIFKGSPVVSSGEFFYFILACSQALTFTLAASNKVLKFSFFTFSLASGVSLSHRGWYI